MLRGLLLLLLVSANQAIGGSVQTLPSLPNGVNANAVRVDASGNIYVAGWFVANPLEPGSPTQAFVGKLSPDGSQIIWWNVLDGSQGGENVAIALGSDASVYVTGTNDRPGFPTTPGSLQPTTSVFGQAFAVKLNPNGAVVYATYIGGSAQTSGNAIAVDSAGDAFITGTLSSGGVFPTTPGAVTGATRAAYNTSYIVELDPTGSTALVAISGFGGYAVAVDPQGNIYAAGSFVGSVTVPTTSGAFQTTAHTADCPPSEFLPCDNQHVAKIDPTGTHLIYGTYLGGAYGATPSAIAVDSSGNVIVAGSTTSPDYPTTPAAYQPEYFATPNASDGTPLGELAPAPAGYITKLDASGSNLIWSTLFSGSSNNPAGDVINGIGIDAGGNILLGGSATSSDLPGLWLTPVASRRFTGFVARLSPDGTTLSPTQILTSSGVFGIAVRADGSALVVPTLTAVSISSLGRIAAICDTADAAKIVSVAPGQLLTLYGTNLAPLGSAPPSIAFPPSLNGVTVTFNGIAAPILYTSGIQINLQVPYEIAGQSQVTMQVSSQLVSPPVSESYILAVVERQPSVFISGPAFSQPVFDSTMCNGQPASGLQPLALNADGTQNSCANPAASGSAVTIFLNGLGMTAPAQTTGMVSGSAVAISPVAASNTYGLSPPPSSATNFLSTTTVPGSIDSLAQVQIQVSSPSPALNIVVQVQQASENSFLVRGPGILIWVQPSN
jgi:uncharacterized protein (TIGR03437 family)